MKNIIDEQEIDVGNVSEADDIFNTINTLLLRHDLNIDIKYRGEEGGTIFLRETSPSEFHKMIKRVIKNTEKGFKDRVIDCVTDEAIGHGGGNTDGDRVFLLNSCLKQFDDW